MKILIRNQQRHRPLDKPQILNTAKQILSVLEQEDAELSILLVGNKKMAELNALYRGISKPTDVLSFEAGLPVTHADSNNILGDIVINVARSELQAREAGYPFYDEIKRLLIHGTLHLLGYEHVNATAYQARKMRKKEQEIFNATEKMD